MRTMETSILTNIQLHQIKQLIADISSKCDSLDPDIFEDAEKLARYDEILDYYSSLLESSYRKARIQESNLRVVS